MKDVLQARLFAVSKTWLAFGGKSLPGQPTFKMSKHHKIQKRKKMINTKHSCHLAITRTKATTRGVGAEGERSSTDTPPCALAPQCLWCSVIRPHLVTPGAGAAADHLGGLVRGVARTPAL